jgi:glutamate synthase (NADPH) small chain
MENQVTQQTQAPMPAREAGVRATSFDEVALGYTLDMALQEAARCIECPDRPCVPGCPLGVDIPECLAAVAAGDMERAWAILSDRNRLPAVCGRVCSPEAQCEQRCAASTKGEPVAIGRLERFVADYAAEHGFTAAGRHAEPTGRAVAIIGSGPAGLSAAADLARCGHAVTIFEALHQPGGVLLSRIPAFRLPRHVVAREVEALARLGVEIRTNAAIGPTLTLDDLFVREGFDAIFVASGAGMPYFPRIPGVHLVGVYSATEYLTRSNLMQAYPVPAPDTPTICAPRVAVIGGGPAAVDAVRTAKRAGAERAWLVYRRSREEMPARREEVAQAEEEGIELLLLAAPAAILGDDHSRVRQLRCQRMELGPADASGRRRPQPVPGDFFDLDVEVVVFAIGQGASPRIHGTTPDLHTDKLGHIVADVETGATEKPGVFAGGEVVTGGATVIAAMGAGRRAAAAIDRYLATGGAEWAV